MIARLTGNCETLSEDQVILDIQGVGYELYCSQNSIMDFEFKEGLVVAYVFTHVREDCFQLFGFSTISEKKLFLNLIKVNGVGPKMALGILSATSTQDLFNAIERQDVKFLSNLPKIGKKKAEQIILTLRGQLVLHEKDSEILSVQSNKKDITSALSHLGFSPIDVEQVVSRMPNDIDVQNGIREGLSQLGAQV